MSQTQKDMITLIMNWGGKIIFGVSSFLLVSFAYELKTDVKEVKYQVQEIKSNQMVTSEKVRRIERVVDHIEDSGLKK